MKRTSLLLLIAFIGVFVVTGFALAEGELVTEGGDQISFFGKTVGEYNIATWVYDLYVWCAGVVGILAALAIVWGGQTYLTSAGNAEKAKQGKTIIIGAVSGLVLVILTFIILNTLDPRLVRLSGDLSPSISDYSETTESLKTCKYNADCDGDTVCNDSNKCVSLPKNGTVKNGGDCDEDYKCISGLCNTGTEECIDPKGSGKNVKCKRDQECAGKCGLSDSIFSSPDSKVCTDEEGNEKGSICKRDDECNSGKCLDEACLGNNGNDENEKCELNEHCASGLFCVRNKCAKKKSGLGDGCDKNSDCDSGNCNTGYDPDECVPTEGVGAYKDCKEASDCISKICVDQGYNQSTLKYDGECAPEGGMPNTKYCTRNEDCASGYCEKYLLNTSNECKPKP